MPEGKDFEREVLDRLIKIEAKLESWDSSKKQVYENQREIIKLKEQNSQQQKDIECLVDGNKWLKRTVVGAVVTAVVSSVIAIAMTMI
ncbi:MAG: hemolysin XhlA family protein [Roseburia sp.]